MKKKNKMSSEKAYKKAQERSEKAKIAKEVKEEKEHIDNMVVLSFAVALLGAFALLYLKSFHVNFELKTRKFLDFFSIVCSIGVVTCAFLYFVKKKSRNFLITIPYLVGTALIALFLGHYNGALSKLAFLRKLKFFQKFSYIEEAYILVWIALAVYLIVSLIWFGIKSHKLNKMLK